MAVSLHGEWQGDPERPPLLFLHGYLGACDEWHDLVEELKDRFYCGAVDLPGHGGSVAFEDPSAYGFAGAAEALRAFLARHHIASCHWYGYSLGGRLALYMAVHHPACCRRVLVESASPGLIDPARAGARALQDERWARRFEQEPLTDVLRDWYHQPIFASLRDQPETFKAMWARRCANDPRELARVMRGFSVGAQQPLWKALPTLAPPLLVLTGRKDHKYREVARRMREWQARIEVNEVPDAGHNVHVEQPAAVAQIGRAWFSKQGDGL